MSKSGTQSWGDVPGWPKRAGGREEGEKTPLAGVPLRRTGDTMYTERDKWGTRDEKGEE